ncbi:putative transposase [Bacillus mycoides NBRC 101238 = DSM 11821]|nr:putative transposase [Bacillus mycoides NBRC 101238 = DSM 11821]
MKTFEEPTLLTTAKAPALLCGFNKLRDNGFYKHTTHYTIKHLNNLIEQDHRHVKRRFSKLAGFQNLRYASRTLKGIETVHALYKQNRSLKLDACFSTYNELKKLFIVA